MADYWSNFGKAFNNIGSYFGKLFNGQASFGDIVDNNGLDLLGAIFGQDPDNFGLSQRSSQPTYPINSAGNYLFSDKSILDQYYANLGLQEQAQGFNSAEAEKEREWSKMMSDTAFSRQMEDIKKAGYNPLLALSSNGAPSYSAVAASSGTSGVSKPADQFSSLLKTAVSASAIVKVLKAIL